MDARRLPVRILALAFAFASWLPTQQPASAGPPSPSQRLVYELPLDAMQRSLRAAPERTINQLLDEALPVVRARVGAGCEVRREGAIGFTVTVPAEQLAAIPELRSAIELQGTLEFRMLARADTDAGFDLAAERTRLRQWLAGGGKERVLADARNLDAFHADQKLGPIAAGKLRWIVHRIRVDPDAPDRWQLPVGGRAHTQSACEPLYAEADYDSGQVPARFRERPHAELIELVAVDLHQRGFEQHDLDPLRIDCSKSDGGPCLDYSMQPNAAKDYADWSEQNVGHTSAILWNDELLAAPTFMSRIPGSGRISGAFTEADVARMAKALRSGALPAAPKFLRQEAVTTDR